MIEPMQPTTVVLLPGLLCDHAVWSGQQQVLSQEWPCHVADYGAADSIEAMADAVLAALPSGPIAVAGHSMGGRVALELARRMPQRLERIALLDTGMDPLAPGEAGERERAGRMDLVQKARAEGMRAMGRQWARGMVHPSRLELPLFEAILEMIGRKTPDLFEAQQRALLARPDARPVLRALACPTLLLCGRDDAWSPPARHEQMHQALPGSRLLVVEHSGHMAPMEQPQAVSQALLDWLRQR